MYRHDNPNRHFSLEGYQQLNRLLDQISTGDKTAETALLKVIEPWIGRITENPSIAKSMNQLRDPQVIKDAVDHCLLTTLKSVRKGSCSSWKDFAMRFSSDMNRTLKRRLRDKNDPLAQPVATPSNKNDPNFGIPGSNALKTTTLLGRIMAGDPEAENVFLIAIKPRINNIVQKSTIARELRDPHIVEEVVNDCLLEGLKAVREGKCQTWVDFAKQFGPRFSHALKNRLKQTQDSISLETLLHETEKKLTYHAPDPLSRRQIHGMFTQALKDTPPQVREKIQPQKIDDSWHLNVQFGDGPDIIRAIKALREYFKHHNPAHDLALDYMDHGPQGIRYRHREPNGR